MTFNFIKSANGPFKSQKTLLNPVHCADIGVHLGQMTSLTIMPAQQNHGIHFRRLDISNSKPIPALWSAVSATDFCTSIRNDEGVTVSTIEHLMAALAIMEIDNAIIEVDGPEIPIMDGSAQPFINLMAKAGVQELSARRQTLRVIKEIAVEGNNNSRVSLKPASKFAIDFTIDFMGRAGMSVQQRLFSGSMDRMRDEISSARTYGFLEDVTQLQAAGFAKGGSLDNAVVIDQGRVINQGGLRYDDECVRHKILDAIGDLYLAGVPIQGFYQAYNGGHGLNNKLLHALMADTSAWTLDESTQKNPRVWQPNTPDLYELQVSFG